MQNIRKALKHIDMKKIEKYVVFKSEDEFGFHYMVIDKLPGEEPTHPETLTFKKKTSSSRKPLSLYEKHTVVSVQAGGVRLLLKWSTFSLSRQFALRSLKKFSHGKKIDYICDTNKRIRQ